MGGESSQGTSIEEATRRLVRVDDDTELSVIDAGPADGPVVILAHGFPELAYSWRHQVPALARAGYRVLAPDQRGYGASSRPEPVEAYDIEHLAADLLALIDDVEAHDATLVGHDWGAMQVWQTAVLHPRRVNGVVGVSVPFQRRPSKPPVERMREKFAGMFFYMVWFQEHGPADRELGADPATTMRRLLAGATVEGDGGPDDGAASVGLLADDGRGFVERMPEPDRLPDWLDEDDLDVYVRAFEETGFTPALNWYRNMDRNWHLTARVPKWRVSMPCAYIGGSADPVVLMSPPDDMGDRCDDLRAVTLVDGAGHWIQQEAPDEVNAALLDFLEGLDR